MMAMVPGAGPAAAAVSSTDACMSIVHNLMCYRQGGESESFSKRAVESLVKKLKDKKDELDALIAAVTSNGQTQTKCVTIPRTLDGRLQVAGRKGFPHVIYAKIWRWPDLHKNELKQLSFCQYSFEKKADAVCVNPYHYERVVSPSIDLSTLSLHASEYDGFGVSMDESRMLSAATVQHSTPGGSGSAPPPGMMSPADHIFNVTSSPSSFGQPPPPKLTTAGALNMYANLAAAAAAANQQSQSGAANSNPAGMMAAAAAAHRAAGILPPGVPPHSPSISRNTHQWTPETSASVFANASGDRNYWTNGGQQDYSSHHAAALAHAAAQQQQQQQPPLSTKPVPKEWCHVQYYELDSPVGELFKASKDHRVITVDGYVDPVRDNRFCLGALSNVHRTTASDKARLHIGKGVQLEHRGEGDVWLKCLSQHPVFVRSYYLDRESGRSPGELVHKIYPNAEIKVFDLCLCKRELNQQANTVTSAVAAQAAAVSGTLPGPSSVGGIAPAINFQAAAGIGVDDLRKLCLIRISFVKGWGPDYVRPDITATPCWIEVTLCRALQLLDDVLVNLPGPDPRSSAAIDN